MTHTFKPGDILAGVWGYSMTNAIFCEVTKVTPTGVRLRELASEVVETTGYLAGTAKPKPGAYVERNHLFGGRDEVFRRVDPGSTHVRVKDFIWLHRWDGRPVHFNHCD